jgi:hypothetical protein
VPVAINCTVPPAAICGGGAAGPTLMAASWMTLTVVCANPEMVLDAVLQINCAE